MQRQRTVDLRKSAVRGQAVRRKPKRGKRIALEYLLPTENEFLTPKRCMKVASMERARWNFPRAAIFEGACFFDLLIEGAPKAQMKSCLKRQIRDYERCHDTENATLARARLDKLPQIISRLRQSARVGARAQDG